jgi:phytoene dehydrogenase-like protein
MGVQGPIADLAHCNTFLTQDEEGEYASFWSGRENPFADPTLTVACPSVSDPTCAPPGCSSLFVMAHVPALQGQKLWTETYTQRYRKQILLKLQRQGLKGLSAKILTEQIWTPETFASRFGAWRGALYGPSGNGFRQMLMRPPMTDPEIRGLYYVGGSVHRGGGAPLSVLSGKIVAERIAKSAA